MIRLVDVTLSAGAKTLLEHAELHVRPGDRVGLVGRNGTGKTTLLRLMVGQIEAESGAVHRRGGITFGYLPQQAVSGSTRTVWEEARSGMIRLMELEAALSAAEVALGAHEPGAVERHAELSERFRLAGGYAIDERVGEVLHGLGFGPDSWHRTCDTFSGGWQMRIALARMLLSSPDVMVLDEPTNHLDLASRTWLARHLPKLDCTLVVVSHDRFLLDTATTRTVELRHQQLTVFNGTLTAWIAERARRDAHAEVTRARQEGEIARLERFVDRFGAKATKAAAARSKQKQIDRIELVEAPRRESTPRFTLPEAPGCARDVLELRSATVGWGDTPVVGNVDLLIERGQRWVFLGPNGAGKSTLLHALSGRRPLMSGRRMVGRDVRMAVFAQDVAAELPKESTALDHVLAAAPAVGTSAARAALGALGLSGDAALRPIGALSGGEKARVVLATLVVSPANVLLLDEPTNHLDAITVDAVATAIEHFEGAVVLVTHDRWLVERVATHVGVVRAGRLETSIGVLPEHLEPVTPGVAVTAAAPRAVSEEERKERKRQQRRYDRLEADVEALSAKIEQVDVALGTCGSDHERATRLSEERAALEAQMEAAFEELETLEAALSD